jgi:hypothetical protein
MVFNATFNNISAISWRSVLLVEKTGVPRKKPTVLPIVTDKYYHIMLYRVHLGMIGTDCIGSCKSNYHTIITTTIPNVKWRKPEYPEKITDQPLVTDKLYHILLYWVKPRISGIQTQNVSGDSHCTC